jgi:hypothetical protein
VQGISSMPCGYPISLCDVWRRTARGRSCALTNVRASLKSGAKNSTSSTNSEFTLLANFQLSKKLQVQFHIDYILKFGGEKFTVENLL